MEAAQGNALIATPDAGEDDRLPWSRAILAFAVLEAAGVLGGFLGVANLNIEWVLGTGSFCAIVCAALYLIPAIILMVLTRFGFSKKGATSALALSSILALILAVCFSYWLALALVGI